MFNNVNQNKIVVLHHIANVNVFACVCPLSENIFCPHEPEKRTDIIKTRNLLLCRQSK